MRTNSKVLSLSLEVTAAVVILALSAFAVYVINPVAVSSQVAGSSTSTQATIISNPIPLGVADATNRTDSQLVQLADSSYQLHTKINPLTLKKFEPLFHVTNNNHGNINVSISTIVPDTLVDHLLIYIRKGEEGSSQQLTVLDFAQPSSELVITAEPQEEFTLYAEFVGLDAINFTEDITFNLNY